MMPLHSASAWSASKLSVMFNGLVAMLCMSAALPSGSGCDASSGIQAVAVRAGSGSGLVCLHELVCLLLCPEKASLLPQPSCIQLHTVYHR